MLARARVMDAESRARVADAVSDRTQDLPEGRLLTDPAASAPALGLLDVGRPDARPATDTLTVPAPTAVTDAATTESASATPGGASAVGSVIPASPVVPAPGAVGPVPAVVRPGLITQVLSGCEPEPSPPPRHPGGGERRHRVRRGETLSGIAAEEAGSGRRWPEVFKDSTHIVQPDGRRLTDPDLIYEGWEVVTHPHSTATSDDPGGDQRATPDPAPDAGPTPGWGDPGLGGGDHPGPGDGSPGTDPSEPPRGEGSHPLDGAAGGPGDGAAPDVAVPPGGVGRAPWTGGLDLGAGLFVGLGLAGAVSAALVVTRGRESRGYRPGSGDRTIAATPPVVRGMHIGYRRWVGDWEQDQTPNPDREPAMMPGPRRSPNPGSRPARGAAGVRRAGSGAGGWGLPVSAGVLDGDPVTVDLGCGGGIALHGFGAGDAARAVLAAVLAGEPGQTPPGTVLIPAALAAALFGEDVASGQVEVPDRLRITADLPAALGELDALLLRRERLLTENPSDPDEEVVDELVDDLAEDGDPDREPGGLGARVGPVLLVASPPEGEVEARMLSLLSAGSSAGVGCVVVGDWAAGGAGCRVGPDGIVQAARSRACTEHGCTPSRRRTPVT